MGKGSYKPKQSVERLCHVYRQDLSKAGMPVQELSIWRGKQILSWNNEEIGFERPPPYTLLARKGARILWQRGPGQEALHSSSPDGPRSQGVPANDQAPQKSVSEEGGGCWGLQVWRLHQGSVNALGMSGVGPPERRLQRSNAVEHLYMSGQTGRQEGGTLLLK